MQIKSFPKAGGLLAGLMLIGAASNADAQFAMGADVSWLQQSEAMGEKFYDRSGKAGDCLAILKGEGINSIRLRTWVNPNNNAFSGHCSKNETIAMAMRVKKLGMRVMIDFHYHDTWVSVGQLGTPKAWQGLPYEEHKAALAAYVTDFCKAMRDSGVSPEWFQNGNETNSGLNPPTGSRSSNPVQMTGLFNAGYDAIKAIFPNTKVLIHVAQPQKTEGDAMLSVYKANGGKLDAIGWSSYANDGNVDGIVANVKTWKDKYKLETIMVEIGSDKAPANNKTLIEKWNAGMQAMSEPCQSGTFYWEPQAYGPPGNWNDAIFDQSGKPTIAFDAYKVPVSKACALTAIEPAFARNVSETANSYLNPLTRLITIRESGWFKYSLMDMSGQTVEAGKAQNTAEVGKAAKNGVYVVKVQNQAATKTKQVSKY